MVAPVSKSDVSETKPEQLSVCRDIRNWKVIVLNYTEQRICTFGIKNTWSLQITNHNVLKPAWEYFQSWGGFAFSCDTLVLRLRVKGSSWKAAALQAELTLLGRLVSRYSMGRPQCLFTNPAL